MEWVKKIVFKSKGSKKQTDLGLKKIGEFMKKNKEQLELDLKLERKNSGLSENSAQSKVKADLLKALKGLEVKTASDDDSEEDEFFDNLITVEELAVIFRLAPQTIRNWVALGKLPYVKIGRRNMFLERSLERWLNRKEEPQCQ